MKVPRRVRFGLVLGGTVAMLFALSLFGMTGLGAPSAPMAKSSAGLHAAVSGANCPAIVSVSFTPMSVVKDHAMSVSVATTFVHGAASTCAFGVQYSYVGLPAGCTWGHSATFSCVPLASGIFHVRTTVLAQNTATTVLDTLVVH
jgi:hypothetical protein